MPLLLPTSNHWKTDVPPGAKIPQKPKVIKGRFIGPVFARMLFKNIRELMGPISKELEDMLPWLVNSAGAEQAAYTLTNFQETWRRNLSSSIPAIAMKWRTAISEQDKERLARGLARTFHVDTAYILDDDIIAPRLEPLTWQAVNLITTVPDEYIAEVRRAILNQYANIPHPEDRTLAEQIQHIAGITNTRAKFIARDQTAKMASVVQQVRQTELGIVSYVWRNSRDNRVVGNPSGLYPKGNSKHGNHWVREGKPFYWDEPPADGHPGWPIACRCYAEPIVNPESIDLR